MNEFEQELRSLPRSTPSRGLDARIEVAFAAAARADAGRPRLAPWLWWCGGAVGLAATAAITFVVTRPAPPPLRSADTAIYRIETPAPMRALLLEPARSDRTPPRVVVRVSNL